MGNITWQDKAGGRGKTLKLAGALTIEAASELRDALLQAGRQNLSDGLERGGIGRSGMYAGALFGTLFLTRLTGK